MDESDRHIERAMETNELLLYLVCVVENRARREPDIKRPIAFNADQQFYAIDKAK